MNGEVWRAEAACRGTFDLMFDPESVTAAVALCAWCPVAAECDAYATATEPPAGIWAGRDAMVRIRAERRLAREAKAQAG